MPLGAQTEADAASSRAPRLPALFSDHMVLQRDRPVPIWGQATPGARVALTLRDRTAIVSAGEDGRFRAEIGPFAAGGPYTLSVESRGETVRVEDVLIGEVWVCSGQSNMEWSVKQCADAEREIANADHPRLRIIEVPRNSASEPQSDFDASWARCSPESVASFSAVGYYFGRHLLRELDVPIGLVQSAWGGTPAETWTSPEALAAEPDLAPLLERWQKVDAAYPAAEARWQEASSKAKADGKRAPRRPSGPWHHHHPSNLYRGMITPLVGAAIRGAIWYQGESNASRAHQYATLFPAMIRDWRRVWGQGDFPFYFVQLANFGRPKPLEWAELREAQSAALALPATGMAVTIDIGNAKDIHPRNKQDVGARLALWALAQVHGRDVVYSGPLFRQQVVEEGAIRLRFEHAEGLAVRGGGALGGFEVASADGEFVAAEASIEGGEVVVRAASVQAPAHVRYAYTANPESANLINGAGLPASPFRTDARPWTTRGKH